MAKGINRTDTIPAILRADGGTAECKCTVALVTKLTPGTSSNAVATCLCIDSAEQSPPDGNYRLDVRGRIFKVRREGGRWPVVNL